MEYFPRDTHTSLKPPDIHREISHLLNPGRCHARCSTQHHEATHKAAVLVPLQGNNPRVGLEAKMSGDNIFTLDSHYCQGKPHDRQRRQPKPGDANEKSAVFWETTEQVYDTWYFIGKF